MNASVRVDRDGNVTAWSEGATALLGYPAGQAVGRAMDFFIPAEERAGHWAGFHRAMASDSLQFGPVDVLPVDMVRADGTRVPVDVTIVAERDEGGRITALVATVRPAAPRDAKM